MSGEFPFSKVSALGTPGFFGLKKLLPNVQTFTATGIWVKPTPPPGKIITGYRVIILGNGGGGASDFATSGSGPAQQGVAGGDGGGFANVLYPPTDANFAPATIPVTIGVAGIGQPGGSTTGAQIPQTAPTQGTANSLDNIVIVGPARFTIVVNGFPTSQTTENGGQGGQVSGGQGGSTTTAGQGGGASGSNAAPFTNTNGGKSGQGAPGGIGQVIDNGSALAGDGANSSGGGAAGVVVAGGSAISGQGGDGITPGAGGGAGGPATTVTPGQLATAKRGGNGALGFVQVITLFG